MENCSPRNATNIQTHLNPHVMACASSSEIDGLQIASFIRCDNADDEFVGDPKLIGIIGDEDTCVGFILGKLKKSPFFGHNSSFFILSWHR